MKISGKLLGNIGKLITYLFEIIFIEITVGKLLFTTKLSSN